MKITSIKTHLIATLLICILLPSGLIGAATYWFMFNDIKESRIDIVRHMAAERHQDLRIRLHEDNERGKNLLSVLIEVCQYSDKNNHDCAADKLKQFEAINHTVGLTFHSGIEADHTLGAEAIPLEKINQPFLPGQLAATTISKISGIPLYSLVATDSASGFSLVTTYPVQALQTVFVDTPVLGQSGENFLVDNHGFFITKSRYPSQQGVSAPISALPMQRCLAGESSKMLYFDYHGVPIIHGFHFVPEIGGGCIMAHVDQAEAFAPMQRMFLGLALAAFLFACFAWLMAARIGRAMTQPIVALTGMAQALSRGDFAQQTLSTGYHEIETLSRLFNSMAEQLHSTIDRLKSSERTLEQKVIGRTIELDQKHRKYHSVIKNNGEGFWRLDTDGNILEINPACARLTGYSETELIGMNIADLEEQDNQQDNTERLHKLLQQSKDLFETRHRRKDGSVWDVEVNATFIDEDGGYFVAFFKDITERKQAELKNQLLVTIVQSSDDAIISKTLTGIVTSWNAGAEAMFGYSAGEMIGESMLKLFPAERVNEESLILDQITHGQRVSHFETVRIRSDGSPIDVSESLSPIFDGTGKIVGVSKIVRDITLEKRLERELQAAKQAAETANHSKSEFLANMSHEIRTPMNAILGLTRLATETELTPKQRDYLNKIQTASQALLGILNDILDLSKIESGRMEIERIEFDPTVMLQNVSDMFIAKAEEQGLEIFLDVSPDIPLTVIGDPLRIRQILSNLVSNAIKFTPKGEIHIRMELIESSNDDLLLRLSVRDTGIGMDKSTIERLFQSFSQADASITRKFGGSGLGLAISKQLVELLGGRIDVTSQPGQGSIFSFAVHCGKGQPYDWNLDSHHLHDARVLVIDDQETSCTILKNTLESWQLYAETALSAVEGLQKIVAAEQAGTPFNLLLLDWQMEGMDGLELVQELEQKKNHDELVYPPTIIMVTAHSKEQLLKAASDMYAPLDAILTKPVVPSCLLNTILHVYHYQGKDYHIPETPTDPYVAAHPLYDAHVLLVEDNKLNQQVASEFLEKAGLRITIANHGGEAVQWVQKENFAAVLMDLQMPEMDGFEATRQIRAIPAFVNLPIIAMTAAAMHHDRKICLDIGMNDHVAKPINPLDLINTLLRWIKPDTDQPMLLPPPVIPKPWSDLADMLPGFKLNDIVLMLRGDQEQLATMLTAFREQFIDEAAAISANITADELVEAKNRLHTLKGAAGNLGAKDLHQACDALEIQLECKQCDASKVAEWVEVFDRTMATIVTMRSRQPTRPLTAEADNALPEIFADLDALLNKNGFVSDKLLSRLKTLLPDGQQENYNMLTQYILDTNYPEAKAVLRIMMELPNG